MQRRRLQNSFESEAFLFEWFRTGFNRETCALIPVDSNVTALLEAVLDDSQWEDLSGKNDPPPDFVSPSKMLMLEVMRVDDHERPGDRKGFINPVHRRENNILKEYEGEFMTLLDMAAENATLTVVGKTRLSTIEDHSYEMYLNTFKRIVAKHGKHTSLYRRNHPGHRLVFFVFDESSAYFEATKRVDHELRKGDGFQGRPHYFFADAAFLEAIKESKADYFIWYAPFKHEHLFAEGLVLPEIAMYDVARINVPEFHYDATRMISAEA